MTILMINVSRDGDRGSSGYRSRDGDGDSLPDSDHWATSTDNNWTDYDQEVCVYLLVVIRMTMLLMTSLEVNVDVSFDPSFVQVYTVRSPQKNHGGRYSRDDVNL